LFHFFTQLFLTSIFFSSFLLFQWTVARTKRLGL
jgi:hypothetical protein